MNAKLWVWTSGLSLLLAGCGEDDGRGGEPDLLYGLSGFLIFCLVVWLVVRWMGKR